MCIYKKWFDKGNESIEDVIRGGSFNKQADVWIQSTILC